MPELILERSDGPGRGRLAGLFDDAAVAGSSPPRGGRRFDGGGRSNVDNPAKNIASAATRFARPFAALLAGAAVLVPAGVALAEALSPEQALEHFKVADGFQVELVASEPEVRQPVTMTFDDRGRMWVIQYLQYPDARGLEAGRGRSLPAHQVRPRARAASAGSARGRPDHDSGRHRRRRPRRPGQGFRRRVESRLGPGAGQRRRLRRRRPPTCCSIPIATATTCPTATRRCLLNGFGLEDAHAVVNSLQWGPDGWLYGAQGSTVTADIRGIGFQQGHVALSPGHEAVRAVLRRGRQHLGPRFRSPRQRASPAPTTASASACTRCKAATTSKAFPSTGRCTILTPTATSNTATTRGTAAATSPAAASSIRAAPFPPRSTTPTSAPTCSPTPSTTARSSRAAPRSRPATSAHCSKPTTSGSVRSIA